MPQKIERSQFLVKCVCIFISKWKKMLGRSDLPPTPRRLQKYWWYFEFRPFGPISLISFSFQFFVVAFLAMSFLWPPFGPSSEVWFPFICRSGSLAGTIILCFLSCIESTQTKNGSEGCIFLFSAFRADFVNLVSPISALPFGQYVWGGCPSGGLLVLGPSGRLGF